MVKWNTIKKFLPLIGVVIFVYFLVKFDVIKIMHEILNAFILNPLYILIAIVFQAIVFVFLTLKWYFLALKQKIMVPFKIAFKINLITNFYGFITPSRLGSFTRAGYLKEYGSFGKGVSNFVFDKVFELIALFLIVVIFGVIFQDYLPGGFLIYILILFVFFSFFTFIFVKKNRARIFLRFFYKKFIPEKMKEKAKFGFDSFYEDMPQKKDLFYTFLLNILTWVLIYFVTFLFGLSVGIDLGFMYFLAILPIGTLVAQIPISISGLGTRELTLIGLFSLFGIEASKVFSMSVIALFFGGIIPSLIGFFLSLKKQ